MREELNKLIESLFPGNNSEYQFSNGEQFPSKQEFRKYILDQIDKLFIKIVKESKPNSTMNPEGTWQKAVDEYELKLLEAIKSE